MIKSVRLKDVVLRTAALAWMFGAPPVLFAAFLAVAKYAPPGTHWAALAASTAIGGAGLAPLRMPSAVFPYAAAAYAIAVCIGLLFGTFLFACGVLSDCI